MGWNAYNLENDWQLWTRHGTCGVYIQKKNLDEKIEIPSALLRSLVAEDILEFKQNKLEEMQNKLAEMETDEILDLV